MKTPITTNKIAEKLLSFELWVIGGLALLTFVNQKLLLPTILTALFLKTLRWWLYGHKTMRTPVDCSVIVLILLLPLSYWVTNDPEKTHVQSLRLLSGIALFYAAAHSLRGFISFKLIMAAISLIGINIAMFTFIGIEWELEYLSIFFPFYEKLPTLVSDTANPNVIAGTLGLLIPFLLGIQLKVQPLLPDWLRTLIWISQGIMILSLVITQSRAGIISVLLACFVIAFMNIKKYSHKIAVLFGVLLFISLISVFMINTTSNEQIQSLLLLELRSRIYKWHVGISLLKLFPLTGVGLGSYQTTAYLLDQLLLTTPEIAVHAHNIYLQIAVDMGIPGFIAWLSIFITMTYLAADLSRLKLNKTLSGIGIGLLGMHTAMGIHGMFDAVVWGTVRPAPLVWGLWGITTSAWLFYKTTSYGRNASEI
jgi:putative inorganic carbon (HCO3(-)) transporter